MTVAPARTSVHRTLRMEFENTTRAPDPRLRGVVAGAYQGYRELADVNRAVRFLDNGTALSWAGIAYDCGYNDQSHLIRDFREFNGHTPTALAGVRRDTALFQV